MSDDEQFLTQQLTEAFGLIAKLARAADIMCVRLGTLEDTVARLEAEAALRRMRAAP